MVTTAGKPPAAGDILELLTPRELYDEPANPPPQRLFTDDLSWNKKAIHTDDVDSFVPVNRLDGYAAECRIGLAFPRFYGVTTDYRQSRPLERYAPQILEWCREHGLDAVLLSAF